MANTRKTTTAKAETAAKTETTYTEDQVQKMIENALAQYAAKMAAETQKPVTVVQETQKVTLLFMGGIASGTVVALPNIGKITRDGGVITVPKDIFLQNIYGTTESLLRERKLLCIEGLTEEEMERFDLSYNKDEVLTVTMWKRILDYDIDTLTEICAKLCDEHLAMVCKMFMSAFVESKDGRVTVEKVKMLNKMSKRIKPEGLLSRVLDDMGRSLSEE